MKRDLTDILNYDSPDAQLGESNILTQFTSVQDNDLIITERSIRTWYKQSI